jgi:hypothetical protein
MEVLCEIKSAYILVKCLPDTLSSQNILVSLFWVYGMPCNYVAQTAKYFIQSTLSLYGVLLVYPYFPRL